MKEGECVTEMKMEEKRDVCKERERERESTATSGDKE